MMAFNVFNALEVTSSNLCRFWTNKEDIHSLPIMVLNVFNALHINNACHQSLPHDYVNRNHWQCLSMFVLTWKAMI